MAILEKILIRDFRNIEQAELEFSPSLNCICGDNGQGKTNLLDAVYYLSMTKSFSAVSDSFCTRHGAGGFALSGLYVMPDGTKSRFVACVEGNEKSFKRDDKAYKRMSEHMGKIPVVMVSPADSALVSESGDERRRFVNSVLSQLDVRYLISLQRYNKYLAQRNHILKDSCPDPSLLDVLDEGMAVEAASICSRRREFARDLCARTASYYNSLSGGNESVTIEYSSDAHSENAEEIKDRFASLRQRDMAYKYTTSGPHRDDFLFLMDGYPIRKCGSQGQQKSFLVALKLSQYDIMKKRCDFPPILLLDDLFDKLDYKRTSRLLELVNAPAFGQIFLSDSSRQRVENVVADISANARFYLAEAGNIVEIERND